VYGTSLFCSVQRLIESNAQADIRYWRLLHAICHETREANKNTKSANHRDLKTWLTPLLHRIPLGPAIVSFFTAITNQENHPAALASEFTSCITILWSIAVQKMNAEILQECFGASLLPVSSHSELRKVGLMVTASYRDSLANFSNKKKASVNFFLFLNKILIGWLLAVSKLSSKPYSLMDEGTTSF